MPTREFLLRNAAILGDKSLDELPDDCTGEYRDPENPTKAITWQGKEAELAKATQSAIKLMEKGDSGSANGVIRKFVNDCTQNKMRSWASKKNLDGIRTRFLHKYAKEHGVRYSALVSLVGFKTSYWYNVDHLRGEKTGYVRSTEWWGKMIGCSSANVFYLLKKAKRNGHLNWKKGMRGVKVWISSRTVWAELNRALKAKHDGEEPLMGFYNIRLAKVLGVNASIALRLMKTVQADGTDRAVHGAYLAHCFPWLTENAWRLELQKLYKAGAIQRTKFDFIQDQGRYGYQYFATRRTVEDRAKWKKFTTENS